MKRNRRIWSEIWSKRESDVNQIWEKANAGERLLRGGKPHSLRPPDELGGVIGAFDEIQSLNHSGLGANRTELGERGLDAVRPRV